MQRSLRVVTSLEVHQAADEWHSEECAKLLGDLDDTEQQEAHDAAIKSAKLLWGFLDGIHAIHLETSGAC